MAKNKLEKPKKETQVNGHGKFENGKLTGAIKNGKVPFKKNGKTKMTDIKKVEKEMERAKFARDNVVARDIFIKRVQKDCAFITIKNVKTSKPDELEPVILFRAKKICQLAFSKVAFFSQYRFEKSGRSIFKPVDQNGLDECFDWVTGRIQQIEDSLNNKEQKKTVTKKPKSSKEESVEDLEKRIENLSPKSNALHVSEITDEILSWAESSNYKLVDGNTLLVRTA